MARDPQKLRKAYESKLGKDLVAKLTDQQIDIISKFYNSLGNEEQSAIDSRIFKGYDDSELHEMAKSFAEENDGDTKKYEPVDKFVDDTQERLDEELKGTSDSILNEIDKLIAEYQGKVDSVKKSSTKLKEKVKEKSSALAVIVGDTPEKEEELIDEDIDSRILELLGIQDTVGLDYGEYKSLLKEKMMADRIGNNEVDSGDAELVSNEYKRIKGSTGKFKVKSKKINAQSFVAKTKPRSDVSKVIPQLPPAQNQETEESTQKPEMDKTLALVASKLSTVDKNVQQTAKYLNQKDKTEEKDKKEERYIKGQAAKEARENRTEKSSLLSTIPKLVGGVVAPIKDLLGGFFDFLKKLGFAIFILELMRFLENPAKFINNIIDWTNKQIGKLETSIENFVIDKMVNPLNGMIRGLNDTIGGFVDTINPILQKLSFLGIETQLNKNDLKVPEIKESDIRNGVALPQISNVDKDFLNFGQVDGSGKPETAPQETLMGRGRSQSTSSLAVSDDEEEYLMRLMIAEAGGEGELGMAAVARSVLNRAGLIQSGKVGAGTFMSKSGSITDVIEGTNQYQPFGEGKLEKELTEEDRVRAKKALEMARNQASLRANLEASGMSANQINNIMASTGFRTGAAFNDSSQNVNRTKLGNHIFNTAGNTDMLTPGTKVETAPAPTETAVPGAGKPLTVPMDQIPGENAPQAEIDEYFRRLEAGELTSPGPSPGPTKSQQQLKLQEQRKRTEELMKGDPRFTPQASVPTITPPVQKAALTPIGSGSGGTQALTDTSIAASTQSQINSFSAIDPTNLSIIGAKAVYGVIG